jgi:succinate dehydrogenase/fumarate reductase flavoprotein subunit
MNVPVLIVGGGGAGLTASMLLSRLGIETLLVSRYPETSPRRSDSTRTESPRSSPAARRRPPGSSTCEHH